MDRGREKAVRKKSRSLAFAPCSVRFARLLTRSKQKKIPRIGLLSATSFTRDRAAAFRQGLRELGYEERKNITAE